VHCNSVVLCYIAGRTACCYGRSTATETTLTHQYHYRVFIRRSVLAIRCRDQMTPLTTCQYSNSVTYSRSFVDSYTQCLFIIDSRLACVMNHSVVTISSIETNKNIIIQTVRLSMEMLFAGRRLCNDIVCNDFLLDYSKNCFIV